jgi:dUTP pyrophosphatase
MPPHDAVIAEPSPQPGPQPGPQSLASPAGPDRRAADVEVLIQRLDPGLPPPSYAHPGDAGADLLTAVDASIEPGERALLPTGVAIALPDGYAAFVHPRSGLAVRHGVSVVNAPGTVDAGYRGEIKVIVVNHDPREAVVFRRGDRIAQLVIQKVERARFHEVQSLPGSARAAGGFGSTGGHVATGPGEPGTDEPVQPTDEPVQPREGN